MTSDLTYKLPESIAIYTNNHPSCAGLNAVGKFEECVAYAEDRRIPIVEAYSFCDFHETGGGIPPMVFSLLEAAEAAGEGSRPFDLLVVHEWGDLARSPYYVVWLAKRFQALGIEIYFLADESSSDDEGWLDALPANAEWMHRDAPKHIVDKCGSALSSLS